MNVLTSDQIIKALECCAAGGHNCDNCPIDSKIKEDCECGSHLAHNARILIKELTEKNELLASVNGVLEADIADRDKLLEQKVADVYPEFMKDYKLMQKELDFYFDKNEEESELLEKAISTFGADAQLTVAIEELSELIKELCKAKRGAVRLENVIEEMADCHIMLDQLSLIFSIDYSEITAAIAQKLNRLKEKLKKGE